MVYFSFLFLAWIILAVNFFMNFTFFDLILSMVFFTKNHFEQYDVKPVFFFKHEADAAMKKDKTIILNHFAAEPLINHSVSYTRET